MYVVGIQAENSLLSAEDGKGVSVGDLNSGGEPRP